MLNLVRPFGNWMEGHIQRSWLYLRVSSAKLQLAGSIGGRKEPRTHWFGKVCREEFAVRLGTYFFLSFTTSAQDLWNFIAGNTAQTQSQAGILYYGLMRRFVVLEFFLGTCLQFSSQLNNNEVAEESYPRLCVYARNSHPRPQ